MKRDLPLHSSTSLLDDDDDDDDYHARAHDHADDFLLPAPRERSRSWRRGSYIHSAGRGGRSHNLNFVSQDSSLPLAFRAMVASGSVLLACGAIVGAQGFIAAPRGPVRLSSHFPNYVEQTRGAGVTPVSSSEGFRDTVLNLSGVVWDAVESQMEVRGGHQGHLRANLMSFSSSIFCVRRVQKGKDAEAETLSQLGKVRPRCSPTMLTALGSSITQTKRQLGRLLWS